jgi:hypothetical protein
MAAMNQLERKVYTAWSALPYHGYTACMSCSRMANCCGTSPETRVCLVCFEFKFNCVAPRRRRSV